VSGTYRAGDGDTKVPACRFREDLGFDEPPRASALTAIPRLNSAAEIRSSSFSDQIPRPLRLARSIQFTKSSRLPCTKISGTTCQRAKLEWYETA
jgi:hypothetical protein